jgi:hypothetical protein
MSFDRPGLPHTGHKAEEVEIDADLREEGIEFDHDGHLDGLDHPGERSAGPQPNPPRRPDREPPAAQDGEPPTAQEGELPTAQESGEK